MSDPVVQYCHTMKSAEKASAGGRLEAWVHEYLRGEGNNTPFSDGLRLVPRHYHGPIEFPLSSLVRCTGPEDDMKYRVPADGFERRVGNIQSALRSGFDVPPLIVNYSNGVFELNDGNHRYEALVRVGAVSFGTIIWTTEETDMKDFLVRF